MEDLKRRVEALERSRGQNGDDMARRYWNLSMLKCYRGDAEHQDILFLGALIKERAGSLIDEHGSIEKAIEAQGAVYELLYLSPSEKDKQRLRYYKEDMICN